MKRCTIKPSDVTDFTAPQFLADRISMAHHPRSVTFIITQEIEKKQQRWLEIWMVLWLLVGAAWAWSAMVAIDREERLFFGISLAFWSYFAFRSIQVVLWRRRGREMIRVAPEAFSIKRAYGTWGNPRFVPLEQVSRLEVVKPQPGKFLAQWEQSFWMIGGAAIEIHTARGVLGCGLQLDAGSAQKLAKELDRAIREMRALPPVEAMSSAG
jgi:hypothetical protein